MTNTTKFMIIDPGFGSSQFRVAVTEWYDNNFQVLFADSYERPLFDIAIQKVIALAQRFSVCKIMCDGANPSVIKSLKQYYNNSEFVSEYHRSYSPILRFIHEKDMFEQL